MFVVAIASSLEMRCIKKKVLITDQTIFSGTFFFTAILNGREILFVKTGVGPKKASSAARQIVKHYKPVCVLSIGAAGGIDPALRAGDCVIINNIIRESGQKWRCDEQLSQKSFSLIQRSGLSVSMGGCLTSNRFIHLKKEKKKIFDIYGVSVIDMESEAIARTLGPSNIVFFDVRVVSDTALHDTLNINAILQCKKTSGSAGVLLHYLKNPYDALYAIRLRKNILKTGSIISRIIGTLAEGL